MAKPTLRDRAEYALARVVESAISRFPQPIADRVATRVARTVANRLRIRRKTVESNLRRAFPEADDAWIEETTRRCYEHFSRELLVMIRLSRLSREDVVAITEIPDEDLRAGREALAEGRGLLFVTGHYGNWEVAAAAVAARGMPIDAIVRRQRNPLVNERFEVTRRRLGMEPVDMVGSPKRVALGLRQGHTIGIVGDQDARSAGVFVPFFGQPASTFKGPAIFALTFRAPLFAAIARRLPDGRYRITASRVPVERKGDQEADVTRITAELAARLEAEIREDPSQYFWFHRRWKTRPPQEPRP